MKKRYIIAVVGTHENEDRVPFDLTFEMLTRALVVHGFDVTDAYASFNAEGLAEKVLEELGPELPPDFGDEVVE